MTKRVSAALAALLMVLALFAGCSLGTKEFTCKELTMEVPSYLEDASDDPAFDNYTFVLDSGKIAVFGLRESFDFLGVDADFELETYAEALQKANSLNEPISARAGKDYLYFTYDADTDLGKSRFLVGVFKSEEAFWMVEVVATLDDYDEDAFFTYLDSVQFD